MTIDDIETASQKCCRTLNLGECTEWIDGLDGYTRWSGKVVPMLFQNWLNKSDSEWTGNPSVGAKSRCPDGGWHCWSTREAAEAAIAARAATGPIGGVA